MSKGTRSSTAGKSSTFISFSSVVDDTVTTTSTASTSSSSSSSSLTSLTAASIIPLYVGNHSGLSVASKKILKKDATTRIKGLADIHTVFADCSVSDATVLLSDFIPFYIYAYTKLCIDDDRRVREKLNLVLLKLVEIDKRSLGPHMKEMIGPWLYAMADAYTEVSTVAIQAFHLAIPQKKRSQVLLFLSQSVFKHFIYNFNLSPETLSDMSVSTKEDADERFERVYITSIKAVIKLIEGFNDEENAVITTGVSNTDDLTASSTIGLQSIVSEKYWNQLPQRKACIRNAGFQLIATTLSRVPRLYEAYNIKKLSSSMIVFMKESHAPNLQNLYESILLFLSKYPSVFQHINVARDLLPQMKLHFKGDARTMLQFIVPLLGCIPVKRLVIFDNYETVRSIVELLDVVTSTAGSGRESLASNVCIFEALMLILLRNGETTDYTEGTDAAMDDLLRVVTGRLVDTFISILKSSINNDACSNITRMFAQLCTKDTGPMTTGAWKVRLFWQPLAIAICSDIDSSICSGLCQLEYVYLTVSNVLSIYKGCKSIKDAASNAVDSNDNFDLLVHGLVQFHQKLVSTHSNDSNVTVTMIQYFACTHFMSLHCKLFAQDEVKAQYMDILLSKQFINAAILCLRHSDSDRVTVHKEVSIVFNRFARMMNESIDPLEVQQGYLDRLVAMCLENRAIDVLNIVFVGTAFARHTLNRVVDTRICSMVLRYIENSFTVSSDGNDIFGDTPDYCFTNIAFIAYYIRMSRADVVGIIDRLMVATACPCNSALWVLLSLAGSKLTGRTGVWSSHPSLVGNTLYTLVSTAFFSVTCDSTAGAGASASLAVYGDLITSWSSVKHKLLPYFITKDSVAVVDTIVSKLLAVKDDRSVTAEVWAHYAYDLTSIVREGQASGVTTAKVLSSLQLTDVSYWVARATTLCTEPPCPNVDIDVYNLECLNHYLGLSLSNHVHALLDEDTDLDQDLPYPLLPAEFPSGLYWELGRWLLLCKACYSASSTIPDRLLHMLILSIKVCSSSDVRSEVLAHFLGSVQHDTGNTLVNVSVSLATTLVSALFGGGTSSDQKEAVDPRVPVCTLLSTDIIAKGTTLYYIKGTNSDAFNADHAVVPCQLIASHRESGRHDPYYTIQIPSGSEVQTERHKLMLTPITISRSHAIDPCISNSTSTSQIVPIACAFLCDYLTGSNGNKGAMLPLVVSLLKTLLPFAECDDVIAMHTTYRKYITCVIESVISNKKLSPAECSDFHHCSCLIAALLQGSLLHVENVLWLMTVERLLHSTVQLIKAKVHLVLSHTEIVAWLRPMCCLYGTIMSYLQWEECKLNAGTFLSLPIHLLEEELDASLLAAASRCLYAYWVDRVHYLNYNAVSSSKRKSNKAVRVSTAALHAARSRLCDELSDWEHAAIWMLLGRLLDPVPVPVAPTVEMDTLCVECIHACLFGRDIKANYAIVRQARVDLSSDVEHLMSIVSDTSTSSHIRLLFTRLLEVACHDSSSSEAAVINADLSTEKHNASAQGMVDDDGNGGDVSHGEEEDFTQEKDIFIRISGGYLSTSIMNHFMPVQADCSGSRNSVLQYESQLIEGLMGSSLIERKAVTEASSDTSDDSDSVDLSLKVLEEVSMYERIGSLMLWLVFLQKMDTCIEHGYSLCRARCGSFLCRSEILSSVFSLLLRMVPGITKLKNVVYLYQNLTKISSSDDMQVLAAYTLYRTICIFPSMTRNWFSNNLKRGQKVLVSKFVEENVHSAFVKREVLLIESAITSKRWLADEFIVTGNTMTGEISAALSLDEAKVEMRIKLPPTYPLQIVQVESAQIGLSATRIRRWILQIVQLLSMQDGTVVDALLIWKKNVEKELEGVEPCPICYSILHPKTLRLPNLSCPTCSNKFHSQCLYTWFKSSGKSKCVICQQSFYK